MCTVRTPWKKSRTYGDIFGGREYRRFADNIFRRAHSIQRPSHGDILPILIEENPSRDFFFPISASEILLALKSLPKREYGGITHIWMRRLIKADFIDRVQPLAYFACGSGVRVITLFPWPKNMTLSYGSKKPPNKIINEAKRYGAEVVMEGGNWVSKWNIESLRRFYIQGILFHEVGYHLDQYCRIWSRANSKQVEEFADQYAIARTANATRIYNKLVDG